MKIIKVEPLLLDRFCYVRIQTDQGITKVRGQAYPMGEFQLVPTYHPAAALRSGGVVVAEMRADLVRAKLLLGWGS